MARSKKKKIRNFILITISIFITGAVLLFTYLWWLDRQASFIRYKEFGIAIPSNYSIHGIDVSRYQQIINWEAVKEMNVQGIRINFAFIKATEGIGNVDFYFNRNWRKARKSGLTCGAYHFFLPTKDGTSQAKNFIEHVKLQTGDLPPVVDIEQTFGVSRQLIQQRLKAWLYAAELAYGVKPIIYTNVDFYKKYLGSEFNDYPLWAAHYLQPVAPRIMRSWLFWQHSESGRVNGISGKVDFNVFNADSTAFKELLLK